MMPTRFGLALLCLFLTPFALLAQPQTTNYTPLDGITYTASDAPPPLLDVQPLRDADVLWEKRVWRVIDTREKVNLPFRNYQRPFVSILMDGIASGELTAYSPEGDRFQSIMTSQEIDESVNTSDTVWVSDVTTGDFLPQLIVNEFDPESVVRYRVQEVWYFNKRTSRMEVRILGIAPLVEKYDDRDGSFLYEYPLFWVHYPSSREYLAQQSTFTPGNDRGRMSWADRLDMRFFDSHVYKESNVHDRRLSDYLSGVDLLWTAEQIEEERQNKEQDFWSY